MMRAIELVSPVSSWHWHLWRLPCIWFPDYGELVSLYLLPEYMGRGMGSVLLDASLKALSDAGFTNVLLWVLEDNLRAHKFYERSGFINSGEAIDDEIDGKPLRELAYIKSVK